jgi:hypothetical protein
MPLPRHASASRAIISAASAFELIFAIGYADTDFRADVRHALAVFLHFRCRRFSRDCRQLPFDRVSFAATTLISRFAALAAISRCAAHDTLIAACRAIRRAAISRADFITIFFDFH